MKFFSKAYFILYTFLIVLAHSNCYAQYTEPKISRTISVSEFIEELQNSKVDQIELSDLKIVPDENTDQRYLLGASKYNSNRLNWDSILPKYPPIVISKPIRLINIYFGRRIILPKLIFKKHVHLEDIDVYGDLTFRNCTFEQFVYFVKFDSYFLDFVKCNFYRTPRFESVPTEQTSFFNCNFLEGIDCYQNDEPLSVIFMNNKVAGRCNFISERSGGDLLISNSVFKSGKNTNEYITLGGRSGFLDRLTLVNDTFSIPINFSGAKISNNLLVSNCAFHQDNYFENIVIPESSTKMRWNLIKDFRLGVSTDGSDVFNGKSILSDTTIDHYFDLIKVYSQFLRSYKNNGDLESYNACYIEMKDIQTKKARFNFDKAPSVSSFFDLLLNKFLKIFCDYGTNPVKAILMSIVVMLFFGFLYFIFPSDNDRLRFTDLWRSLWDKSGRSSLKFQVVKGLKQLLNAFALSMNAFVTLGYGDMPAKGVARYLAVLEGLTGWFLLSIFSSSLISQILQ